MASMTPVKFGREPARHPVMPLLEPAHFLPPADDVHRSRGLAARAVVEARDEIGK